MTQEHQTQDERPVFDFGELVAHVYSGRKVPALKPYTTRDGSILHYRHYRSRSDIHLVLLHGSGAHGMHLAALATRLCVSGAANVYTPDIRGHGPGVEARGDCAYPGQIEHDIEDLLTHIRAEREERGTIVIGGHSLGGGLALRFAGNAPADMVDACLLIAPFLRTRDVTVKARTGGWTRLDSKSVSALRLLNRLGIHAFDGRHVLHFNLPEQYRDGTETLSYSHRLRESFFPRDYQASLRALDGPLMVVAGRNDEAFHAERFPAVIEPHAPRATVSLLDDVSHLGMLVDKSAFNVMIDWLKNGVPHHGDTA